MIRLKNYVERQLLTQQALHSLNTFILPNKNMITLLQYLIPDS